MFIKFKVYQKFYLKPFNKFLDFNFCPALSAKCKRKQFVIFMATLGGGGGGGSDSPNCAENI